MVAFQPTKMLPLLVAPALWDQHVELCWIGACCCHVRWATCNT
jgi:hypothetical protein